MKNISTSHKSRKQNKDVPLKIATYNIATANISSLEKVAEAIKAIDPDIIALQEVDKNTSRSSKVDQIEELKRLTGMPYGLFGKAEDYYDGEYGIGILSKYPIIYNDLLNLPSEGVGRRVLLAAEISDPRIGGNIVFMCTHLDSQEDNTIRNKQIQAINSYSIASTKGKIPSIETKLQILAGDFNEPGDAPLFKEVERYFTNLIPTNIDARTWPAVKPAIDINHILSYNNYIWQVNQVTIPKNQELGINWQEISNHLPIILDLSYTTNNK